jgi:DDE superfamily endonuclease
MLVIPDFAQPVLSSFAPVFYHPTYQRFLVLLVAAVLTTGRRTVANLLRTAGDLAHGDPSSYHRVLSRRRWSSPELARILIGFILDHWIPEGAVSLAGDDTVDEHRGAKVYGKGCHRDPVRSTHSYTAYRWGHKWVVLTILVPFPFAQRSWALPVLVALYRSPEKAPKAEAKTARRRKAKAKDRTKAKAKKRARRRAEASRARGAPAGPARRHKTPSELMRQLLAVLIHWFPDRQFVFAGDGGYGTHALARFAQRHRRHLRVVSLFYPNAALHDPPPVVVGKKNGRPRKKGDRRPTPAAVVAATEHREALEVSWYGGGRREVEAVSGTGHWHKSGEGLVEVRWVYVHDRTGTHRDSYLFSTDPTMEVARVIETYTGRWSIETMFQEMRAYLGLETTRGWSEATVLRAAPCLFGLYAVVALLYAALPAGARAEGSVSYRGKAEVTFSDAISVVRRRLWLEGVFESHGQTEVFENLPLVLRGVILAALAPAA